MQRCHPLEDVVIVVANEAKTHVAFTKEFVSVFADLCWQVPRSEVCEVGIPSQIHVGVLDMKGERAVVVRLEKEARKWRRRRDVREGDHVPRHVGLEKTHDFLE